MCHSNLPCTTRATSGISLLFWKKRVMFPPPGPPKKVISPGMGPIFLVISRIFVRFFGFGELSYGFDRIFERFFGSWDPSDTPLIEISESSLYVLLLHKFWKIQFNIIEMLEEFKCIPQHAWRFIFAGKPLTDGQTMSDRNIQEGDVIHLVFSLRGGTYNIKDVWISGFFNRFFHFYEIQIQLTILC